MQRLHGSWSRCFQMVRVRSATTGERCTFWPPPPYSGRCGWAPPPLGVCYQILSPLLATATSLSIIFIACSPLLPRSAPRPSPPTPAFLFHRKRRVFLLTECWLLPKSTVGEMCLAPPPWSPARPTSRVLWWPAGGNLQRMQARKRYRMICAQRLPRCTDDCRSALAPSPPPAPTLP